MMPRERYVIEIDRPDDMTVGQMTGYLDSAIGGWRGGMNPDEPIFQAEQLGLKVWKQRRATGTEEEV